MGNIWGVARRSQPLVPVGTRRSLFVRTFSFLTFLLFQTYFLPASLSTSMISNPNPIKGNTKDHIPTEGRHGRHALSSPGMMPI
jgi:hypothetical protein